MVWYYFRFNFNMSYKNLEVWKLAQELSVEIHEMTLTLPNSEKYEEGQQIRRSIKTVRSTLVEGYGRRLYKQDFIRFIIYALSSNDETIDHLEMLYETKLLKDQELFERLHSKLELLGKKLNTFLKAVQLQHNLPSTSTELNEPKLTYAESGAKDPESGIQNHKSSSWTTLSSHEKYDNHWINVTEFQVINPGGKPGIYGKVHFKNKAIGIVAIDDHMNTWLVGQHRYVLNEWSWEIPEGGGPLSINPLNAAMRELQEETGLIAKQWRQVLRVHLSNSVSDEEGFIFLAQDLTAGDNSLEDTEADLKVWKLPFKEALRMVQDGEITDSLSVMGLMRVGRMLGI